jgi:23S rRNA (cytosine1962-C5)-methyltransferase
MPDDIKTDDTSPGGASPDDPKTRPVVTLVPGRHKRAAAGHPWVYSNEIAMDEAARALPAGALVTLKTGEGKNLGVATFNSHPLVSARILDREPARAIDDKFLAKRLRRALSLRERLYREPYYRLVHADADGLPGLVIDRYGGVLACQLNTAGMARLEPDLLAALDAVLGPDAVVFRNDSAARTVEGLATEVRVAEGHLPERVEIVENGARFRVDLAGGQKTGWFFDQRENRAFMARLAGGARVLDLYSFGGGFGIAAAMAGATEVLAIDRSEASLALAAESAALNGVAEKCRFQREEVFAALETLVGEKQRFEVVIADPPAFIKSKKEVASGLRGYRKLARLAAQATQSGGFLFIASCSHNAVLEDFAEAVRRGIADAGRSGRILLTSGAAPDHPVHPFLPESAYLKAQVYALD